MHQIPAIQIQNDGAGFRSPGLRDCPREVGRPERGADRPDHLAALGLQRGGHGLLRRPAVHRVRGDHEPPVPVGFHQMRRDGPGQHPGARHEHECVGITAASRQLRDMRPGHHEQPALLLRHLRHGQRHVAVEGAHECIHPVVLDQLASRPHGGVYLGRVIGFEDRNRPAQHTAGLVEAVHRDRRAVHIVDRGRLVRARERVDDADLDRFRGVGDSSRPREPERRRRACRDRAPSESLSARPCAGHKASRVH
jgi:hypothetical protein